MQSTAVVMGFRQGYTVSEWWQACVCVGHQAVMVPATLTIQNSSQDLKGLEKSTSC